MIYDDRVTRLIEFVYAAGSKAGTWTETIDFLMSEVGCVHAALALHPRSRAARQSDLVTATGSCRADVDAYVRDFAGHNLRRDHVLSLAPGRVSTDGHTLPLSEIDSSFIQNEYFKPRGWGYAMYAWLSSTEDNRAFLALHQEHGDKGFSQHQVATLEALVPHLARAMMVYSQLERAQASAKGLEVALEHLPLATAIVDSRCKLVCSNTGAEQMLRRPDMPLTISEGLLVAARAEDTARLARAVAEAMASLRGRSLPPTVLRFPRPIGDGILTVLVSPLLGTAQLGGTNDASVMLCFSHSSCTSGLNPQVLAQEFELTPSEASIAARLGTGSTIAEIAVHRSVSVETVRTQVRSLMAKTQTRNQGQLASVLGRSLASVARASC